MTKKITIFLAFVFLMGLLLVSTHAAQKPVKITWMDAQAYGTDKMDAFLAGLKNKLGVEIEIEHDANNYNEVLKTKINSGETPDIWCNMAGNDNKVYAEYSYDFTKDAVTKKFNEDAVRQCLYKGKIYGLPWQYQSYSILYNKKVFAKAGITKLPRTLKELEQTCIILKSKGITPFANGYKEYWVLKHTVSHFIAAEGKSPLELANDITSGKLKFADMKYMKNSFDFIDLTLKYGQNKPLESGWEDIENSLARGDAAMIHMGDWCEPMLKKINPDVEVGFFPLPISDNPNDARVLSNVSWVWKVNKDSKNVAAAKKVLEYFLTSDKGEELNTQVFGCVPCTKNVSYKPSSMLAQSTLQYVSKGLTLPWPQSQWPDGFELKLGNLYQAYVSKEKTREQVLSQLTEEWLRLTEQ